MLKRVLSIALSAILCAAMFAGGVAEEARQVKLYYPSYLQESEGEALVLDKMPERIVCLSNAALQILVRCGIQPVAVTEPTSSVEYPDWVYELPVISTSMTSLDSEAIIARVLCQGSLQVGSAGPLEGDFVARTQRFLTEPQPIQRNEPIPIALLAYAEAGNPTAQDDALGKISLQDFFTPENLTGLDQVQAVTVTFSSEV